MARIERRYNAQRKLTWAKGMARDIYKDETILNSRGGGYRVSGEARLYNLLLPRHCAYNIIGETPPPGGLDAKLPPYREWRFVLVGYGEAGNAKFELSREITGDVVVEVEMGQGKA
jgi:hypothetical protein